MTPQILTDIGFNEIPDVFTGKKVWYLGVEEAEIYYNIETKTCKVVKSEFCIIQRECKTEQEIIKFVEAINFLFGYN